MTGAGDSWAPPAPSDTAIQALLPPSSSAIAPSWPPVISTGLGDPAHRREGCLILWLLVVLPSRELGLTFCKIRGIAWVVLGHWQLLPPAEGSPPLWISFDRAHACCPLYPAPFLSILCTAPPWLSPAGTAAPEAPTCTAPSLPQHPAQAS